MNVGPHTRAHFFLHVLPVFDHPVARHLRRLHPPPTRWRPILRCEEESEENETEQVATLRLTVLCICRHGGWNKHVRFTAARDEVGADTGRRVVGRGANDVAMEKIYLRTSYEGCNVFL